MDALYLSMWTRIWLLNWEKTVIVKTRIIEKLVYKLDILFNLKHVNIYSFTKLLMYSQVIFFEYKSADGSYRLSFSHELYLKYSLWFPVLKGEQECKTSVKQAQCVILPIFKWFQSFTIVWHIHNSTVIFVYFLTQV